MNTTEQTVQYVSFRISGAALVGRNINGVGQALKVRLDLANHSPDGFEWGYGGSGPAQLALALLADATGSDEVALRLYQDFKSSVVSRLNRDGWTLTGEQVRTWVRQWGKQAATPFGPLASDSIVDEANAR